MPRKKVATRKRVQPSPDLPPIIPESLQSDRQTDVGILVARGALALSVVLFVGSLAATLTFGGGGRVLGEAAVREEIPLEDFQAHLDAIRAEYGNDFSAAQDAVQNQTTIDAETLSNLVSRLNAFRHELAKIHVPAEGQDEVFKLVSDIDSLLTALSS
ncbi:MAG: hypothetical protein Q7S89_03050 [bacterium]|nr:hypothetical protein [bacterium]